MNQPWGLSGPQFLGVYGAGIAAMIVIPLLARHVVQRLPSSPGESAGRELDAYEVGYLAGGAKRTAEVIVAELTQAGALRVNSEGRVSLADPGLAATSPAVVAHGVRLDQLPDGEETRGVLKALARDNGIAAIGQDLKAAGLIVRQARLRAVLAIAGAAIVALHATAIARFIEAAHNHRPAGDLSGLFVLSIVAAFVLVPRLVVQPVPTSRGAAYLKRLRKAGRHAEDAVTQAVPASAGDPDPSPGAGLPGLSGADSTAALAVALLGFTALSDTELRSALLAGMPAPSSADGGGGGGCGGGGCGGGCGG